MGGGVACQGVSAQATIWWTDSLGCWRGTCWGTVLVAIVASNQVTLVRGVSVLLHRRVPPSYFFLLFVLPFLIFGSCLRTRPISRGVHSLKRPPPSFLSGGAATSFLAM